MQLANHTRLAGVKEDKSKEHLKSNGSATIVHMQKVDNEFVNTRGPEISLQ